MNDTDNLDYMLTTVDNPYDPFTNFSEWLTYDSLAGYDTPSFLARILVDSYELSEADQQVALNNAMDEIVRENVNGMYRTVSRSSAKSLGLV